MAATENSTERVGTYKKSMNRKSSDNTRLYAVRQYTRKIDRPNVIIIIVIKMAILTK